MREELFLNGRVRRWSLPCSAPSPEAPVVKRLLLTQGELAQFYDGDTPMRYIAALELQPGTLRGNHYHKRKEEWIYLIRGELLLHVSDTQLEHREAILMKAGDLAVIPVEVGHALKPESPGLAVEFSPTRFDLADVFRLNVAP